MASPTYWLLANPSWLNARNAQEIITDLRDEAFDANEVHNQTPLLRAFVESWQDKQLPEAEVLQVAKLLVERGADPKAAFKLPAGHTVDLVSWGAVPAVRHFLNQAAFGGAEHDAVGQQLFGNLRTDGSVDMVATLAMVTLDARGERYASIDGLHPGSWICLHAADLGKDLRGWCVPVKGYGSEPAHMARIAIRMAKDHVWKQPDLPAQDRFISGLGLIAGVDFCNNNNTDQAAREAGRKLGAKILDGININDQLRHFMSSNQRAEQRARMGGALFKSASLLTNFSGEPWDLLVEAWDLLQSPGLDLTENGYRTLGALGLPNWGQLDQVPRTPRNQEVLLDLLVLAFNRFSSFDGKQLHPSRLSYIDHLDKWRSGYELPDIAYEEIRARMGSNFNEQAGAEEALQALALNANAPIASMQPHSRPRL